jgi:hypothetical protein
MPAMNSVKENRESIPSHIDKLRSKSRLELVVSIVLCGLFFVFSFFYDILEAIYLASREYEHLEIDELFTTLVFAGILMFIYALRRKRELQYLADKLEKRNQELEAALARVSELEGIIPICSFCKKIRDDQGYWHKVEEYISSHSMANFSHGLCPECAKKYYKELEKI